MMRALEFAVRLYVAAALLVVVAIVAAVFSPLLVLEMLKCGLCIFAKK